MSRRKASKVSSLARKKGSAARRGEGGTHSGAPRKRTRRLLEAGGMLSHTIPPVTSMAWWDLTFILAAREIGRLLSRQAMRVNPVVFKLKAS